MNMEDLFLPLIAFLIGLLIELGIPVFLSQENQKRFVRLLGGMVLAVAVFWAGFQIGKGQVPPEPIGLCAEYGIKIISPKTGDPPIRGTQVDVRGIYTTRPPRDTIQLFTVTRDGTQYWPHARSLVRVDEDGTWEGVVFALSETDVIVTMVGDSGRALTAYYDKVTGLMNDFPSVEQLTTDVVECDRTSVEIDSQ